MLCGLLLASKVWQDLATWNIEFSTIYPQFSLQSINRLERVFLSHLDWDMYISGQTYAKYYFALRSLEEQQGYRRTYHDAINVAAGRPAKAARPTTGGREASGDLLSTSAPNA